MARISKNYEWIFEVDLMNIRYDRDYHEKLLKLCMKCDLVFQLSPGKFMVPSMLPERDLGKKIEQLSYFTHVNIFQNLSANNIFLKMLLLATSNMRLIIC